jgi:hypothetical protein
MPFAIPPLCRGIIFPLYVRLFPIEAGVAGGKARDCYQWRIDVDNLTEEFYQSLMSGYRMIEDLGRQDCKQKPNGRQTPCKQTPFSGSGR